MPEEALTDDNTSTDSPSGLGVLIFVSVTFGLAFGIYLTLIPLYWDELGIDRKLMGVIFSAAALGVFLLRIYIGRLSDIFGRKVFYGLSLALACAAHFATPLLSNVIIQGLLKGSREISALVRETMHSVLLYERSSKKFMGSLGITRGAEFACHGVGSLIGGLLLVAGVSAGSQLNFTGPFVFSAGLLLLSTVAFAWFFKTGRAAPQPQNERVTSLRALLPVGLSPKLWLLIVFGFTFYVGLGATHCHVMVLFFKEMLSESLQLSTTEMIMGVAIIMAIHRIVAGLPMMIVGPRLRKNLKGLFIIFVFCEGGAIAATPYIPNPWIAMGVWLTHDLLGAGIWAPIHNHYIQKHARPESRGADVSKVQGLSQLGGVVGPLLASAVIAEQMGYYSVGAPFVVGGIIIMLSALVLLKL
jgi:MFS family permease